MLVRILLAGFVGLVLFGVIFVMFGWSFGVLPAAIAGAMGWYVLFEDNE